jgi:hypothetical protein
MILVLQLVEKLYASEGIIARSWKGSVARLEQIMYNSVVLMGHVGTKSEAQSQHHDPKKSYRILRQHVPRKNNLREHFLYIDNFEYT